MVTKKQQEINNSLKQFGKKVAVQSLKEENQFTPNKKADNFIWKNKLAFFLAVLTDQSIRAEQAWAIPYELKKRLGFWNVKKIAEIKDEKIIYLFNEKPKLHRFPKTMALRVKQACQKLITNYKGKPENIWNGNKTAEEIHNNFESFKGIGQKKASMATNILARDFKIPMKNKKGLYVSYDVHVRRVFLRSGLVKHDEKETVLEIARKLNPDYPGIIDLPTWFIGKHYCNSTKPDCKNCPIKKVCMKKISLNVKTMSVSKES